MALDLLDLPSIVSMNFEYTVSLKGSYNLGEYTTKENSLWPRIYCCQYPGSATYPFCNDEEENLKSHFFIGIVSHISLPTLIYDIK